MRQHDRAHLIVMPLIENETSLYSASLLKGDYTQAIIANHLLLLYKRLGSQPVVWFPFTRFVHLPCLGVSSVALVPDVPSYTLSSPVNVFAVCTQ